MTPKAFDLASQEGRRPTWEMALLYPDQGGWTETDYLALDAGRQVEYSEGHVEFQPMPDEKHQAILFFLVQALKVFARSVGGRATMAPFPMRLREERYREPDALFMTAENLGRCRGKFWEGADLVVEILSESNREQDLGTKRAEYAEAGIPEYWIVDPERRLISVLVLEGPEYRHRGEFSDGQKASSIRLPGFEVDVTATFDAE